MDKAAVTTELHLILVHYLLELGIWPVDEEDLPELHKKFRALGLDEDVPGEEPGTTRNTALGDELNLRLMMAFLGVYDVWDVPMILEEYGYLTVDQTDELYLHLGSREAEEKLRQHVHRAYLQYRSFSFPMNLKIAPPLVE